MKLYLSLSRIFLSFHSIKKRRGGRKSLRIFLFSLSLSRRKLLSRGEICLSLSPPFSLSFTFSLILSSLLFSLSLATEISVARRDCWDSQQSLSLESTIFTLPILHVHTQTGHESKMECMLQDKAPFFLIFFYNL